MQNTTHHCFGAYEILTTPAESHSLVIALSGIGDLANNRIDFEFGETIRTGVANVHSILIKDNQRSWYNAEEGWHELIVFIRTYLSTHSITCSTVVGVSMGAFGAFVLAKYILPTRVFAFSSQAEIDQGNHYYRRRPDLISKISPVKHGNIEELLVPQCDYHVAYSVDEPADCLHAERMLSLDVTVHAVRGEHNIAATLKRRGILEKMLSDVVTGQFVADRYAFFEPTELSFSAARAYLTGEKETIFALLSETTITDIPDYLLDLMVERRLTEALTAGTRHLNVAAPIRSHMSIGPGQLSRYLAYGWSYPEATGTWSERNLHIIRMFVAEDFGANVAVKIKLDYSLFSKSADLISQRLIFYVNGEKQVDYVCTSHAAATELFLTDAYTEISIYTPDSASPAEVHGSNDTRELAMRLTAMRIATQPNIPTLSNDALAT